MKYNITKSSSPKTPKLKKGAKCLKSPLFKASKGTIQPLVPMPFPISGAHLIGAEFCHRDQTWKEPCGIMSNLVAESGESKG